MTAPLLPARGRLRQVCLALQERAEPIYLVGGYVRDWLLGKESHDLDLAVDGSAIALARSIADTFRGSFVLLDQEHDTARVVFRQGDENSNVDFARLRGGDIRSDLAARDLTINAIAIHIQQLDTIPPPLIDPLDGQKDIAARTIRAAAEQAFRDDPLRMLRAVRQAATLGFQITPDTEALIVRDAPLIVRVSNERVRDELAQLLACQGAADQMRYLHKLGVLAYILPEIVPLAEYALRTVEAMEANLTGLGDLSGLPADHFAEVLSDVRERSVLLGFAALLHNVGSTSEASAAIAASVLQRLRFSSREIDLAHAVISHYPQVSRLAGQAELSLRDRYRFFRQYGDAGLDIICLSLAVARAAGLEREGQLQVARDLLRYYHDEWPRIVALPRLLDGQSLMSELNLKAGPLIGRLLEGIREAQAVGEVSSPAEAITWAANWLRRHK